MSSANFESLSKQFDIIREAIIANFRDRIKACKRSRLTKQELEELIDIFITRLQSLDDAELIERLCDREIALLEEGYPAASVGKNYLPKYRKAIALAIKEKRIKLNERNSHSYTYFKDGESHLTTEHYALTYLKYDRADYEEFARSTIANNNLKQDSLKAVNPVLYLEAVDSLLDSSQPLDLAIAIAATTGRRYSEVMAKGVFEATEHPYQIHFAGQLKKRTAHAPSQGAGGRNKQSDLRDDSYTIYTLVPAERVVTALERFRTHPDIAKLENVSIEKINQLNTPINRLVKHYFQDTDLVPILKGEAGVTIQNLRGIYGEIAVHFFCPPSIGVHRFIQQKLGHLISDPDLAQRKNSSSTEHYFHYYLVDLEGRQLSDKGILLEQLSSSPKTIFEQSNHLQDRVTQIKQLELPTSDKNSDSSFTEPTSNNDVLDDLVQDSSTNLINNREPDFNLKPKEKVASFDVSQIKHELNTIPSPQNFPVEEKVVSSSSSNQTETSSALDFPEFLAIIRTLMESNDYQHLLVGLMAATGLDAASLLKLLVFKEAAAPHLILYCQQLHPPHQPLQQLLTLLDSELVLNKISALRRDRHAIDFAHRLTGSEINQEVKQFTPDVLSTVGPSPKLALIQQYHNFIPLLLKEPNSDSAVLPEADRFFWSSLSPDTQSSFEQWQQHFQADAELTLIELMRLANSAQNNYHSQVTSSVPLKSQISVPASPEPTPWFAISRLTDTIAKLSDLLIEQNERLFNIQLPLNSPSSEKPHQKSFIEPSASKPQSPSFSRPTHLSTLNSDRAVPAYADPSSRDSHTLRQNVSSSHYSSPVELDDFSKMNSEELKASRARNAPMEKLSRALNAVIQYNQQQDKPEQMWRINTHLLQQLTGCFNSSVKAFVQQHQPLIDQHNQQFALTSVRHNALHKQQDPNLFITW